MRETAHITQHIRAHYAVYNVRTRTRCIYNSKPGSKRYTSVDVYKTTIPDANNIIFYYFEISWMYAIINSTTLADHAHLIRT